ncbi:hypothetical protein B7494_g3097 [Chlorociboria aeruginascens]|nr:hypothetical protein B7494_g3097 [Chlorociboria aeruginascens]
MAPSGEAYNVDWIISNSSNVHVANDRDWFTSFTPFETYCGSMYSNSRLRVTGIGTVQLNAKLYKQKRGRQTNSRIITLHNVLYAPSSVCNIFGGLSSSDYELQLDFSQNFGMVIDEDGNRAGLIEWGRLPRLRLHGQCGWSSLDPSKYYVINAHWPDTECARWNSYQSGQQNVSMVPYTEEAPYSTEEKTWLKKNWDGEYKFLRSHGLSIYKEEDRIHGRAIVRSWMAQDDAEPKGNGSPVQNASMGGRDHNDEDKDEDEDHSEDDTERFLQELEDDPMSHLADYNFSAPELKWIQKHYQYSSRFMLTYGLKPYDQEDCDEAQAIVRAMMKRSDDSYQGNHVTTFGSLDT